MSSNLSGGERWREVTFGVGAFVGMTITAVGIAVLVLAMSIGLREGQTYLAPGTKTALLAAGAVMAVGGTVLRVYRGRLVPDHEALGATGGLVAALIGLALILLALSTTTTVSAPFLASARQKVLLFLIAYVLIAVGLVTIRWVASIVGW